MHVRPALVAAAAVAAVGVVAACESEGDGTAGGALPVVATTTVVADIVENVGGADVDVTTLVGRDSDAHTFEPQPSDLAAIADAAIVFEVGRGFEEWLEDAVEAAGGGGEVVSLSDGVPTADSEDPHVWMTAANGVVMTETATEALADADPGNADAYRERGADYVETLEATGDRVEATLAVLPTDQRVLFTNHDAFGDFAAEHGFELLGSTLSSVTTEGADPSAADIAALVAEIERARVPTIFPENVTSADTLETVADEAGVEVGPELTTGALGEDGSGAETYVSLLESNARIIAEGLATTS